MQISLRRSLALVALSLLAAACSSTDVTEENTDAGTGEGGTPGVPCSRLTTLCKTGETCEGAPDCESKLCREGKCRDVAPADGVKNGDETDVDCGGTASPACADGKGCAIAADCTSGVCTGGICQVPSGTDGVKNGDETGVDCGGSTTKAKRCPTGEGCLVDGDCDKAKCDTTQKKCLPPTHEDGIKNLDETGIDCGGPDATVKRCPTGEGCVATSDCDKVLCDTAAKKCDVPKADDGIKNGTETDIDCGGGAPTNAPKCLLGKSCEADGDCKSTGCSASLGKKCTYKSCATAEAAGINSCGALETAPGVTHESCCKSLTLPTRTTRRLDKYEITSGRFRTFLSKVGPNVRAWVAAYAAANPTSQLATLANTPIVDGSPGAPADATFVRIFPSQERGGFHSLTAHMSIDIDNYAGIRGCANYDGSYSANTYYMPDANYTDFGLPPRSLARSFSDEKPLNCVQPAMLMAFCAWDGGELALHADYIDAWGPAAYPWGPTNIGRPMYNWCNGTYQNGGFTCQCASNNPNLGSFADCPGGGFNGLSGSGVLYEWPRNTDRSKDNEPLIAAPGRITTDASANKGDGESWQDLYANLAEYTGDLNTAANLEWCDFSAAPAGGATTCARTKPGNITGTRYTGIPRTGIIGVSWEGHQYNRGSPTGGFQATFQYGKFGGRCVRPAAEP
ncbi:MAG: hypothetical protein JST00_05535 [Deltaproteobacteria bacterium]|nr:hypothetical protein [Deltaproteobacteria bacterium]